MNSHRRRLSSTAPVPERPATKSSKSGMQNVFWTSTARRQRRKESSAAGPKACLSAHASASRAVLVRNPPNFTYAARLEVLGELQLTHCAIQSIDVHNYVPLGMYTLRDPGATFKGTKYRPHLANSGAPSLLPWSDRLRAAVRCGGVAPSTGGIEGFAWSDTQLP